ncbi:MAG TPA: sigma-54 dependent transcriptional regulator [Bryobacteraceae bacterium]|nr:sigma-54 dependent transcriptional regulator [Bryobacteraceae bacterium]
MPKPRILVIDDDESIARTVAAFLEANGYPVTVATSGEDALTEVRSGGYPVVISDIYIDRVTGLDVLEAARAANSSAAVIVMTARGSVRTTVEAEAGGAFDYLAKPFEMRRLLETVERAAAAAEPAAPRAPEEDLEAFGDILGFSPPMVEVYKRIARYARSEETVLITGESGTGKELVARALHENGPRSGKPFVAVDCGAVPGALWESEIFGSIRGAFTGADRDRPGVLETARGGVVLLDEIGEVPLESQARLLRFLQEKEYRPVGAGAPKKADVRVLAATNRPLEEMLEAGRFRQDLYYRLDVLRIDLPPLRDRRADVPMLVRRFMEGIEGVWIEPEAIETLTEQPWPGNVRQLQNTVARLAALRAAGPITRQDVMDALREPGADAEEEEETTQLSELERRQILKVLEQAGGNKTRAAEMLGIQRRTLYKKLARMSWK